MSEPHPAAPPSRPLPTPEDERLSWFARQQRASVDRAAERVHRELVAHGHAAKPPLASTGLLTFSAVVLIALVAAFAVLTWATFAPKGWLGWAGVVLGWVVMAGLLPRPHRVADAPTLSSDDFPGTHRLVAALSTELGVRPPASIHVNLDFNAFVTGTGWRLRPALVIGLPCWTCLTDDERIALLGHELGHLVGRDQGRVVVVGQAHRVLERLATLITPLPAGAYSGLTPSTVDDGGWGGTATMNWMGSGLLRVLSLPSLALLLAFERLAARDSQRRECLADLRAADIAGTVATERLMLSMMNTSGLLTLAGAAVRRREDPFEALEQVRARPAPTPTAVSEAHARARATGLRWDDGHPRDDLRLEVITARPVTVDAAALATRRLLVEAADHELRTLRPGLSRELSHELLEACF
ncbi:peptidase M48-like protein [Humibacillus xanthopallidus]|uniref:Peptidase M48-like protein n=1 Tax=Humibacillus xanthopallidus TaxID=412689 RepID=A0A543PQY0_9MICO|nr:M48 family metallopeptidase [Humibacillus xanthopallidus]TQN46486.1 peptidase M48-like protein [Humibacillus xanthopallidus]